MFNPMYYGHCIYYEMNFKSYTNPILSLSPLSSISSAQSHTLKDNVTYQVLLVIGIILFVLCSLFLCMYCYIKPNRKRRFFRKIFKLRGGAYDINIDNEPLLVLEDELSAESKEGYFV